MPTLKIPTPLRPYAAGNAVVTVQGSKVSEALADLTAQHPDLRQHIFNEDGGLRPFVNLFLNDEDVRYLAGVETEVKETDLLRIIPSIAGGAETTYVDHAALRTNQAFIIAGCVLAFVFDAPWLAALVALVMAVGVVRQAPGFGFFYAGLLKPRGWVKPDVIPDNPEPHRFAQGFGAVVLAAGVSALFLGAGALGWALTWLVAALAALNLFAGFCAGCAVYYWLFRLGVPGFVKAPPAGQVPGMRPKGN